ncbi:MAG: DDE-type integrase/transposase/recombinase [Leptospiraceae bacterium]|nr:DDE-type integrase/transposase/recombinase [Leptospiraceae bacterium]
MRLVADESGLCVQTVYRKFQALKNGRDASRVSKSGGRGEQKITEQERHICMQIAAVKEATAVGKNSYVLSTERAIEIAFKEGLIDQLYSRTWVERRFKKMGISHKSFNMPGASVRLAASHANQVWLADATPLNKYYLNKKGVVVEKRGLVALKDKHLDDALRRDGLQKIWVYYVVDMFSHVYYMRAFAPVALTEGAKNGGENSIDWRAFFIECFLEKEDDRIPFHGLPGIIYSDKGSGLTSGIVGDLLRRLNITPETHMPGNSRAKGRVEGRISGFKRSFEPILNLTEIPNLERLQYFITAWSVHDNQKSGHYAKWHKSALAVPIRKVNRKNIQDATLKVIERVVDNYGCVSINNEQFFIAPDSDLIGRRLEIYTDLNGNRTAWDARDKRSFTCQAGGPRTTEFGQFKSFGDSEADRTRKEVLDESKKILKAINFHSLLPDESNITAFPIEGEAVQTHSPIEPDQFENPADARLHMTIKTGWRFDELPEDTRLAVEQGLESEMQLFSHIRGTTIKSYCEIITNGMSHRRHNGTE